MSKSKVRQKFLSLLGDYWWVLLILAAIGYFTTDVPLFRYVVFGAGIIFALLIFSPFLFQLVAPIFASIATLGEHFRESEGQSPGKRYIFIPASILAMAGFLAAQTILTVWVFFISFVIWSDVIGFFFTFILTFFFGLAPLAILIAPFVMWYQAGFVAFLGTVAFFLIALFWFGFSKLAFSENYLKSTPEDFLGYSPQTFLLGALSFQVIALLFYHFELITAGNVLSDTVGAAFLLFALVSAFKWRAIKKRLPVGAGELLYRPSAWIYFFGFLLTNLLYYEFEQRFGAPTAVLFWLNGFFLVGLLSRFLGIFKRKKEREHKPPLIGVENNEG